MMYRRALTPEVFFTNWSYVDHVLVPAGGAIPALRMVSRLMVLLYPGVTRGRVVVCALCDHLGSRDKVR